MAEHSPDWYANSDIDWFCRINDINVHVASMGRQLPGAVVATLPQLYEQVSEIEMAEWRGAQGVWYNEELLKNWLRIEESQRIARYLYTFVVMARKGFYSFAPITPDVTDGDYYLMAKPVLYKDRVLEGIVSRTIQNISITEIGPFSAIRLTALLQDVG